MIPITPRQRYCTYQQRRLTSSYQSYSITTASQARLHFSSCTYHGAPVLTHAIDSGDELQRGYECSLVIGERCRK
jgi:hypothetical protein